MLVRGAKEVAAECAVAEGRDAARFGHRVVGDEEGSRMRVVTGPVTSRTSACRGEATMPRPNRCRS